MRCSTQILGIWDFHFSNAFIKVESTCHTLYPKNLAGFSLKSKDLATFAPGHSEVWVFHGPHLCMMSCRSSQVPVTGQRKRDLLIGMRRTWWVFGISQQFLDRDPAQGTLPGPKELTDQMRRGVQRVSEGEPLGM